MKSYKIHIVNFFLKIVLPSFFAIVLFIGYLFTVLKPQFEEAIINKKREMIKELVNSTKSILQKYYNDEKEGIITREKAQEIAISRIQYLRYGSDNKDYFWITDMHPRMIMHPYVTELNGQDLSNYSDPSGKRLFVECVEVVKKHKQGYVEYMWQFKDDTSHILPKLSYVSLFEPWQWIVGTGVYIDDVKKEISALSSKLINTSVIISIIILLLLIFISFQSYKIERKRQEAELNLKVSHEKYRSLVSASTEALVMIKDFCIIQTNERFNKLVQKDLYFNENIETYLTIPDNIIQLIKNNEKNFTPFETKLKSNFNKLIDVLVNISPVTIYEDLVYILTIRDISTYKETKRTLKEIQERFKLLLDDVDLGYVKTTLDLKGRILDANKTTLNLLGYKNIEELKKQYILDLYANDEEKRLFRKELLENKNIINKTIYIKLKDGITKPLNITFKVICDENSNPIFGEGIIKINTDFTNSLNINTINPSNTFFDNLLNSNVENYILPIQEINVDATFETIVNTLNEYKHKFLIINNTENLYLGYITYDELFLSFSLYSNIFNTKAYQIMKSPLLSINADTTVLQALSQMKNNKTSILLILKEQKPIGIFSEQHLLTILNLDFKNLLYEIVNTYSIDKIYEQKNIFIKNIAVFLLKTKNSYQILQLLSELHDSIIQSLFKIAIKQLGQPPCSFAFIVMGSEARKEQTLSTDQDNAIIYLEENSEIQEYFIKLGKLLSNYLDKIGYKYCIGQNMASNEKWVKSLNTWKNYFSDWIHNGNAQNLLDINIFFDIRTVYGDNNLTNDLIQHIFNESSKNKAFLSLLARNCVNSRTQLSQTFNIKNIIAVLVNIARLYALSYQINEKSTILRFSKLLDKKAISNATFNDLYNVFQFLNLIRLSHQTQQILNNVTPDNQIEITSLSEFEIHSLKYAISVINSMQNKVIHDFKLY